MTTNETAGTNADLRCTDVTHDAGARFDDDEFVR
jgi:hypothetical protein